MKEFSSTVTWTWSLQQLPCMWVLKLFYHTMYQGWRLDLLKNKPLIQIKLNWWTLQPVTVNNDKQKTDISEENQQMLATDLVNQTMKFLSSNSSTVHLIRDECSWGDECHTSIFYLCLLRSLTPCRPLHIVSLYDYQTVMFTVAVSKYYRWKLWLIQAESICN